MSITAIWGPPGSGKTSLAIDLAFALSRNGLSVCLISPEPFSEMSALLNIKITKQQSIEAAYQATVNLKQTVLKVDGLLFVLAAPYYTDAFEAEASLSNMKSLLEEAEATFDCVIVDCPAHGHNTLAAWAMNQANTVVLLTGFRSASGLWNRAYQRAIKAMEGKTVPVCLQGDSGFDYRALCRLEELNPAIWVPFYPDAEAVRRMRRTLYDSGGKVGKTYNAAIDELCNEARKEADHEHQFV
jgi:molybdopterin-guanine dinucleotide biosynthesis protein